MIETTTTSARPATASAVSGPRTLDDLAELDVTALEAVYRRGTVPASLHALDGNPVCRMLAVRGLDGGGRARLVRDLARVSWFPWAGKSFAAESDGAGNGINRVRLLGGKRWFPFTTSVEASAIDGAPCIFLDYRHAANPKPIQMIRDELREVRPGLFLGPAMLDTGRSPARLVLWFACDLGN
ncbi:MAG: hypothetical protein F9K40_14165 [Kofleriaceae bacterium]|nr:MAG: hypothetical protein F9K40_14165 [Kofleriaceae bacterium]MBZ0233170.1 hypothetical protein [Kofleriaceae bacterium]